jgi:hypothetical protein
MVVLNALLMAFRWQGMSLVWQSTTEYFNYTFSAIFLLEAILKLTAYPCQYFAVNWNKLDFLIVVASCT